MSLIEIHSHLIARTAETPNPDFGGEEKQNWIRQILQKETKPFLTVKKQL